MKEKERDLLLPQGPKKPTLQEKHSRKSNNQQILPFEAIIMAGGRGERLRPLTDSTPKPLLKIGNRPIVEYTVLRLQKAGIKDFTFCLNYLGKKVESFFGDGSDRGLNFNYIYEQEPLGTIGGLALKEEFRYNDLLLINGDLLTTINFERFYSFFLENDADIAVATIPYRISMPYGILQLEDNQSIASIEEKPTYSYHINTGIYFLRKEVISLIPQGQRFDAIELIRLGMAKGLKVQSFPLLNYWVDIGQKDDYEKAREDIQFLDL